MMFILAAMVAALYGGVGPGLAAAVFGELLGDYFFVPPYHTLGPRGAVEWAYFVSFLAEAGLAIMIISALRATQVRATESYRLAQTRGEQLRNSIREIGEAEARIRELAAIVESAQDPIVGLNLEGEVRSWNAGAERLFGYTSAEMVGQSLLRLVPPNRSEEFHLVRGRLERGESVEALETVRLAKDGRELSVSVSYSPVRDRAAKVVGASVITRDMTELRRTSAALLESQLERKQAEEALDHKFQELRHAQEVLRRQGEELSSSREALEIERSRYRELFDSAPVGYIITSGQGIIEQVNVAATTLLNERAEYLVGLPLGRLVAKRERATFFANLGRLTRKEVEKIDTWESVLQPHQHPAFHCSLLVNRMEDEHHRLSGLRWIIRDITERKQAEEKALRLNAELEQRVRQRTAALEAANREMEAFSYSVSHDLRAPLRSLAGFSKALLEDYAGQLDETGHKYLRHLNEAALRMNRLVNDLLQLSRSTRGELRRESVDLSGLAAGIVAELRKRDPLRNPEVQIAPGLRVTGDEGLLRIALENLLGNAWKFSSGREHPKIEMGELHQNGNAVFFIHDNGAGFNMAHAKRLFGVFQRLHAQEEFPGTGIGLATVRRILTRHGGEVWAEGKVNEGATFYFSLPGTAEPELSPCPVQEPAPEVPAT